MRKATRKGGRSVLLRQVFFASNDSEGPGDVRHRSVNEDKNADAPGPERPEVKSPSQRDEKQLLGTAEESSRGSGMFDDKGYPAEAPPASTETAASSMKSRWVRHDKRCLEHMVDTSATAGVGDKTICSVLQCLKVMLMFNKVHIRVMFT